MSVRRKRLKGGEEIPIQCHCLCLAYLRTCDPLGERGDERLHERGGQDGQEDEAELEHGWLAGVGWLALRVVCVFCGGCWCVVWSVGGQAITIVGKEAAELKKGLQQQDTHTGPEPRRTPRPQTPPERRCSLPTCGMAWAAGG